MSDETTAGEELAPEIVDESKPAAEQATPETGAQDEIEASPDNEPDAGEGDENADQQPKKNRASERISELYGRTKAAERKAAALEAELIRLRQPMVSQDQWDEMSWEEQQAVQVRHAVRSERAEELAREREQQQYEAEAARADLFNSRVETARQRIPDIEAVISDPSLPISQIGALFIAESDKGPQVAYWLGQNRQEAARIARLDPMRQAYELGKVEARIDAAPAARRVSNAPQPVSRVGRGGAPGAKSVDAMSVNDMEAYLRKNGVI